MINRHNELVTNDDVVILMGDLSAALRGRQEHFRELLQLLNGQKYLIRGNHDYESKKFYQSAGIIDVKEYWVIGKYFFCHYPCYSSRYTTKKENRFVQKLKKYPQCTHIIHGHIHDKDPLLWEPDGYTRLNTSVDFKPNNYYPIELNDNTLIEHFYK